MAGPSRCGARPSSPSGKPRTHATHAPPPICRQRRPRAQTATTCSPCGCSSIPALPGATWQGVWWLPGPIQVTARLRADMFRLQLFQVRRVSLESCHLRHKSSISSQRQAEKKELECRPARMTHARPTLGVGVSTELLPVRHDTGRFSRGL